MFRAFAAAFIVSLVAGPPVALSRAASPITQDSINGATPNGANDTDSSLVAKAEILLGRVHFSSGVVDGLDGDNFRGAVRACGHGETGRRYVERARGQ
jgi:hypothetical protein